MLAVDRLSGPGFSEVTLHARPNEIIGLAGIEGNGQRDFLRALAGLTPSSGEVRVNGEKRNVSNPSESRGAGLVYVPRERHREALMLQLGVGKNIGLIALARNAIFGLINRRREISEIGEQIAALSIKTPRLDTQIQNLSGGNQQKAVIARCLMDRPAVLLADEPSQGVDAGARFEIYSILRDTALSGRGVIIASADAMELEGLCDRVLIFSRGSVVAELSGAEVVEHKITEAALTATTLRTQGGDRAAGDAFQALPPGQLRAEPRAPRRDPGARRIRLDHQPLLSHGPQLFEHADALDGCDLHLAWPACRSACRRH